VIAIFYFFFNFLFITSLLYLFYIFLYVIAATKKARKQTGCINEGSDVPDQTLFPCASCTELVNSDTKCTFCDQPMHVFCSAVELVDGVGDAICKLCSSKPPARIEEQEHGLEKEDEQPVKVSEYGELLLRCFLLFYFYLIFISFCLSLFHFTLFVRLLPR
jgi:hypothetical protein